MMSAIALLNKQQNAVARGKIQTQTHNKVRPHQAGFTLAVG